ncbi:phosphatase PAP2 family protein [Streptomyces sp. NPDC017941]|uniref:phosphatase PAP2 family protein n=1 Tax=Streptomyces sp. NPDC017941 TaxID=3365018 RepID=UPI00379A0F82
MDTMDSSGLYLDVTEFARDTPAWVQHLAEVWTELGLLLFGALFVVAWWRARGGDPRAVAVAVLAPLGTALAYVISEAVKSVVEEERPCRAVSGALRPLVECPPHGDWSFPSNHSTIAGAAALGLALAWPRVAAMTLPMAVLMAFSRVFVGVHYPHDVAVGLVLGALVVFLAVRLAAGPVTRITEAMRGSRTGVVRWFAGQGPAAASAPEASSPAAASAFVPRQDGQYRNSLPYEPARAAAPGAGHGPAGQQAEHPHDRTMTLRRDGAAASRQEETMALRRVSQQQHEARQQHGEPYSGHQVDHQVGQQAGHRTEYEHDRRAQYPHGHQAEYPYGHGTAADRPEDPDPHHARS